jgi:RNA polymerase sigma-70 factor (ECF subfamily)
MPYDKGPEQDSAIEPLVIEDETIKLYRRHIKPLSRYSATLTKDRMVAQDAIQEIFLHYFIARINGLIVKNPRAWLFRALRKYITDDISRSNSTVSLDAAAPQADLKQNMEVQLRQKEALEKTFAFLSIRERECVRLRVEGFSHLEIAQIMQMRPSAVGTLMANVVKKIRKIRNHLAKKW